MAKNRDFDPSKPVRTRDGKKARIICTDIVGLYPIMALIAADDKGHEIARVYDAFGRYCPGGVLYYKPEDLVNIQPRIQRDIWVNVYPHCMGGAYSSSAAAKAGSEPSRIACVKMTIDCEEGEGL